MFVKFSMRIKKSNIWNFEEFSKLYKNLPLFLLILNIFVVFQVSNFFYLTTESPDYFHLSNYLKYGFGEIESTNRDLGLAYFNLTNIFISFQSNILTFTNINHFIHNGVLALNTSLYCLGLLGLYKYLINKKFQKNDILWAFCVVTFFPQTINMINTMKPEVLAFSLITWVLYFIENYLDTENTLYLILSLLPLSLILTSKSSILFLSLGLLTILFFNNFYKFFKLINLSYFVLLFFLMGLLLFENYKVNNFSIFQHVSSSNDGAYENIANFKILYNINLRHLITLPFSNFHADSLIGIVLLDTFGDYFNFWAYNDESLFVVNKKIIEPFWFITHYSQFISIIFTTMLYYFLFKFSKRYKNFSHVLLAPIFAIFLLTINSFGIPIKNYNPITSDTFKTHYYSFLLVISFCVVILILFKNNSKLRPIVLVLIIVSTAYLYGFPKVAGAEYDEYLESKNSVTLFCSFNSVIIDGFERSKCSNFAYQVCSISKIINNTQSTQVSENISLNYSAFIPEVLEKNGIFKVVNSREDCIKSIKEGYKPSQPLQGKLKLNYINLSFFIMFLFSLMLYKLFETRKKQI